jgi:hypothetical protein
MYIEICYVFSGFKMLRFSYINKLNIDISSQKKEKF